MSNENRTRDPYLVKSVVHSSRILSAFRSPGEALPLKEIAQRSGLPKTMSFRLLYTLEKCGLIEKIGANLYQSSLRPTKQRVCRLGYAAQGTNFGITKLEQALTRLGKTDSIGIRQVLGSPGVLMECNIYSVVFDFHHNRLWLASGEVPAAKATYREYPLFR